LLLVKPIDAIHEDTHLSFNGNVIEEISMINMKRNVIDNESNVKQMRRNNSDNSLIEQDI